jgi:type I restriction enzyme M protein
MSNLFEDKNETAKINLSSILKGSEYDLLIFSDDEKKWLEERIYVKNEKPYVECISREKEIQLKPEEVVRQLFAKKLIDQYGYKEYKI